MSFTGTILTLDLATNTGHCAGAPVERLPRIGSFKLPSTGEDIGRFAVEAEDRVAALLDAERPGLVVFEMPILPKKTQLITVRKLSGLVWEVERQCTRRKIRCREGRASSVKKFFTGSGRAEKLDTMQIARRYGWRVRTDDEADAAALWAYAVCKVAPEHAARFALGPLGAGVNG
jgi:Holliday junction resolvasome RuvABC endonuclease subunit